VILSPGVIGHPKIRQWVRPSIAFSNRSASSKSIKAEWLEPTTSINLGIVLLLGRSNCRFTYSCLWLRKSNSIGLSKCLQCQNYNLCFLPLTKFSHGFLLYICLGHSSFDFIFNIYKPHSMPFSWCILKPFTCSNLLFFHL